MLVESTVEVHGRRFQSVVHLPHFLFFLPLAHQLLTRTCAA